MFMSLVQLVAGVLVLAAPCPGIHDDFGRHVSCYEPSTNTIYLARTDRRSVFARRHEYGHADDFTRLTDADRARFKRMMGFSQSRGWWEDHGGGDLPPAEFYADNFAYCSMGLAASPAMRPFSTTRVNPRICRMLPLNPLLLERL